MNYGLIVVASVLYGLAAGGIWLLRRDNARKKAAAANNTGRIMSSPTPAFEDSDPVSLERNLAAKIESIGIKPENKIAVMAGDIGLLKWMTATLIALNVAILVKLL